MENVFLFSQNRFMMIHNNNHDEVEDWRCGFLQKENIFRFYRVSE